MRALVSIHDVMPDTLDRVSAILRWLRERGTPPVTLLVVPGCSWEEAHIQRLREFSAEGHALAAHGWHHATVPRRLYHRVHAALISRNVAEHLDLNSRQILALMERTQPWFHQHGLPAPQLYVPPAWALGPIHKDDLRRAPFAKVETTRGLFHLNRKDSTGKDAAGPVVSPRFESLPLVGYEADTAFREYFLRSWNVGQARLARQLNRPLRISIHPNDLMLRVADQLERQIRSVTCFEAYHPR